MTLLCKTRAIAFGGAPVFNRRAEKQPFANRRSILPVFCRSGLSFRLLRLLYKLKTESGNPDQTTDDGRCSKC